MDLYCTRPVCPRPLNSFADLDEDKTLQTVQQKYCISCGMPLILKGRYLPLSKLGRGGFGVTFLACDHYTQNNYTQNSYTQNPRLCIVKQLLPPANLRFDQLELVKNAFQDEAKVLENLGQHPQIPTLIAYFEEQNFFYLVQEYIDGQNLQEELDSKGNFSEDEVLQILQKLLEILQFVHAQGSIHRDIKPSNIMRAHHNHQLYLLDFGTVRQVTARVPTNSSMVFATQGFAPPEQMTGRQVLPSTDLYSLAVTCVCLLTGKRATELYDTHNEHWDWRRYTSINENFALVLEQMLKSVLTERFQSATEVIKALNPPIPPTVIPITPPTKLSNNNQTLISDITVAPTKISKNNQTPVPDITVTPTKVSKNNQTPVPDITTTPTKLSNNNPSAIETLELLVISAFTGFEAGLLLIAITSLLGTSLISTGFWILILIGLICIQYQQIIPKRYLLLIVLLTLILILLAADLIKLPIEFSLSRPVVIFVIATLFGLVGLAFMTLYRLIYKLLRQIF